MDNPEFQDVVDISHSLTEKILNSVPGTHKSCVHVESLSLESKKGTGNLDYMVKLLNIPVPLTIKPLSDNFSLEMFLNYTAEGLQLQIEVLKVLIVQLEEAEKMEVLQRDVMDLLAHINKLKRLAGLESSKQTVNIDLTSRLTSEYEVQVATHLTLLQLQHFCRDVLYNLRKLSPADP